MSSCPFCPGTLLATFTNGLPREKCGQCAAVWFEGESLAKLVGGSGVEALLLRAKGKHGQCKGCQAALAYVPQCPQCGHDAPTCPRCGTAPLSVTQVHGVEVDVCPDCRGVGLDAGELELLQRTVKEERDIQGLVDLKPHVDPQHLERPQCATCRRKLRLKHAFTYDSKLFCGSCAPEGAAPYDMKLEKARPSMAPSVGAYIQGGQGWTSADPISFAIGWLFSKIID